MFRDGLEVKDLFFRSHDPGGEIQFIFFIFILFSFSFELNIVKVMYCITHIVSRITVF